MTAMEIVIPDGCQADYSSPWWLMFVQCLVLNHIEKQLV